MTTFPRGYWTAKTHAVNTPLRKSLQRNDVQTSPGTTTWIVNAGDEHTLRGIPAIGRGVQGRIPGTDPETEATR